MLSDNRAISDLKEIAKWSTDKEQKKAAIKELAAAGEKAIAALQEILNVTVYDEIKVACIDAIKSAKEKDSAEVKRGVTRSSDINKKNESQDLIERDEEKGTVRLADLPP